MNNQKETKRHNITFPVDLYERLQRLAEIDRRSLVQECLYLLEERVEQREQEEKQNETGQF